MLIARAPLDMHIKLMCSIFYNTKEAQQLMDMSSSTGFIVPKHHTEIDQPNEQKNGGKKNLDNVLPML